MAKTSPENGDENAINEDEEINQAVAELEGIHPTPDANAIAAPTKALDPIDERPFEELTTEEVTEQLQRSGQMVIDTCMDIRRGEN
ncbi:hypothetical protein N9A87_04320, partial [Euryarchaeota archaeon]|nr:hypothetical protein [Euryarchaeota archaeon]